MFLSEEAKMLNRFLFSAVIIAITSTFGAISTAQAADEFFCKDYARTAINQLRDAERHRRCDRARERDPARWQPDFRAHYDWCRNVSRKEADFERNERRNALELCTH
jgi:hypothetical protein